MVVMKHLRRLALALLLLLALGGVAYLLLRDVPRRWIEEALGTGLEAEVELGALEVLWPREILLRDLTLREIRSLPQVAEVRIATVRIESPWQELRRRHIERVTVEGFAGDLEPPRRPAEPFPTSEVPFTIDRMALLPGKLTLTGGERPGAEIVVAGQWTGIGAAPAGTLDLAAPWLPVPDLLALLPPKPPLEQVPGTPLEQVEQVAGTLTDVEGRVTLAASPWLHLALRTGESGVRRGEHALTVEALTVEATVDAPGGRITVTVDPVLASATEAHLEATFEVSGTLRTARGKVRGAQLATWLPLLGVLPAGWAVDGVADVEVEGGGEGPLPYRASVRLDRLTLPAGTLEPLGEGGAIALQGGTLSGSGLLHPPAASGEPWRSTVEARMAWPAAAAGTAGTVAASFFPFAASFRGEGSLPAAAAEFQLAGRGEATVGALGEWQLQGSGDLAAGDLEWRWGGATVEELRAILAAVRPDLAVEEGLEAMETAGHLQATGRFRGPWRSGRHRIAWRGTGVALRLPGDEAPVEIAFAPLEGQLVGAGTAWDLTVPPARVTVTAPPLTPRAATLGASVEVRGGTVSLSRGTLDGGELGTARFRGRWSPAGGEARVVIALPEPEPWLAWLEPLLGQPTAGYALQGVTDVELRLQQRAETRWQGGGTVAVSQAGFTSDDGSRVAQGLTGKGEVQLHFPDAPSPLPLPDGGTVVLRFGGFQLLWGTLFADFADTEAQGSITVRREGEERWRAAGALRLPDGPVVEGELSGGRGRTPLEYQLSAAVADLGTTLERYVQTPFQGSVFGVDALRMAGEARLVLAGDWRGTAAGGTARGRLELERLELAGREAPVGVTGLSLELPLALAWEGSGPALEITPLPGGPELGWLEFETFTASGLTVPALITELRVEGDTVALEEGLAVPVFGGRVRLDRLSLARLLRPDRHLATALTLEGVRLEAISRAFELPPLEGELGGTFPRARLTADRFTVEGGGELRAFGGTISLFGISGRNMLSRFPKLTFSADLRDIHLLALTRTFDVGELSGILEGSLRDCQLFQGVPVRCRGRLYTVPRKGVKQYLDVKAINNIAIVGTGSRVTVFDRGIHKFFDRYRYQALGAEIQLVDDAFLLRGLERRGERELFLKGRLPLRIDIVNARPGHTVSFRTMLERLENVSFSVGGEG
jgi:hypothetical protein